ncbi:MAG: nicotinamide-nucleotide amidohydrolase family protein [Candidatus Pelagadaptatus aseana]|uniref:CinA family protein n=1 Tax=Candidatus Pelagadaptatus aseana TaxID=3120508 RepID=UPI0039B2B15A
MFNPSLVNSIAEQLLSRRWVLGTAESCTGGMVAAALTDVSGSSEWFEEGLVTYANHSKSRLLNVSPALLEQEGAVSEATVSAMVTGVLSRGADVAVATSGIAGPGGGSVDKPVGTVWFAWRQGDHLITDKQVFPGDRSQVRKQATEHALAGVLKLLESTV